MEIESIAKRDSVDAPHTAVALPTKNTKKPSTAPTTPVRAARALASKTRATTTTVTKITKLVLKPRAEQKSRLTVTTTQHFSRQTASSGATQPAQNLNRTYQIRNIHAAKRKSTESVRRPSGSFSSGINSKTKATAKENKMIEAGKQQVAVSETMQQNQTKTLNIGVLEEITSAVVNANGSPSKPTTTSKSMAFEIQNTPKKRTKSTTPPAAKSSAEKCKQKSYDPARARQFIREQQEKRKLSAMKKAKAGESQDEIKKRLDILRRNSLKILNKNVKRARCSGPTAESTKTTKVELRRKSEAGQSTPARSAERRPSDASSAVIMSQRSQRERIGILRRPEGLDTNAAPPAPVALMTPLSRDIKSKSQTNARQAVEDCPAHVATETAKETLKPVEPKMDLQMPLSMSLKSSLLSANLSTPNDDRNNEMKFWLRPTPVQPYPYNFIMAVRKKLELVAHPVLKTASSSPVKSHHEPVQLLSPIEIVPGDQPQESPNIEPMIRASPSEHQPSKGQQPGGGDISYSEDYSTNFSSVTLKTFDPIQMHPNEILSSTKNDSKLPVGNGDSQDTLSISSGILSHSSPEKRRNILGSKVVGASRQPTPLSTNHADSLHIVSRSSTNRSVSTGRHTQASGELSGSLDVQKMLSDFNKSLSQVIKVNQQLHTVLSNPPSLRPASVSEQQPTSTEEYSDDVDNFVSDRPTDEKATNEDKTPSTVTPSEQIATEGESIAESITATHSELERRQSSTLQESEAVRSSVADEVPTTASAPISDELATQIDEGSLSTRSFRKHIFDARDVMNASLGSDIFAILKQTAAIDLNSSTWSDGNVSYSNLGMVSGNRNQYF